jgi:hypothetical protein
MPSISVYVGIDVACRVDKKLPICVVSPDRALTPLPIPQHLTELIPRGIGNREIAAPAPFHESACRVVSAFNRIADEMGWHIVRVAVDAPAAPPSTGSRASEEELGRLGLSSFRTPAALAWAGITEKCLQHLSLGGLTAKLPYANKVWALRLRALQRA